MKHLTPHLIAEVTGGEYVGTEGSRFVAVAGAVRDNRDVKAGNLFVCIRGARVDGHCFANSAFQAGAACCLAQRPIPDAIGPYVLVDSTLEAIMILGGYYRRLFDIPFIGITGSVGKTTAKELVAAALGAGHNVLKTQGNLNNELGVPLTLLSLDKRHEAAVIEMGINDFGEMSRLAEMVRPDIFIITKIGYAHLDTLGDLNGVLRAKTEAFAYMAPGGTAILNGDDDLLWGFDPGMRKITFGLGDRNDYRAQGVRSEGTEHVMFDIVCDAGRFPARVPAYGVHIAPLSLAAAAVGHLLGMPGLDICRGLLSYAPVGGRSNVKHDGAFTLIDDCYNANPNSVKAALASLSTLGGSGRRVAILGDMLDLGEQSDELHREIGTAAARCGIDRLLCCGTQAALIYDAFLSEGGDFARHYQDKSELAAALPGFIEKGDLVLVKASNGMKFEELLPVLRRAVVTSQSAVPEFLKSVVRSQEPGARSQ